MILTKTKAASTKDSSTVINTPAEEAGTSALENVTYAVKILSFVAVENLMLRKHLKARGPVTFNKMQK